ncbi:MAG: hypothetical protein JNM43_07025 [Planctomycetaceae bacterium]|nr:hypothetical protein [Planctomycetaceae bacterium]
MSMNTITTTENTVSHTPPRRLGTMAVMGLLSFLSGAACLIAELSWNRQLGSLFGHTAETSAIVLGLWFAGMAIGYRVGLRFVQTIDGFRGYAVCEFIAAIGLATAPLTIYIAHASPPSPLIHHESLFISLPLRILITAISLGPVTIAYGATLPFLSQMCVSTSTTADQSLRRLTFIYALNTAGAVPGTLIAPSILFTSIGVKTSSYVAALCAALCGFVALSLRPRATAHVANPPLLNAVREGSSERLQARGRAALPVARWTILAGLSGFVTLGLEVLYTRLFALIFHNSSYSFACVLATFLLALALGSVAVRLLSHRFALRTLCLSVAIVLALAIPASVWLFAGLTRFQYVDARSSLFNYLSQCLMLTSAVMLLPATMAGMLLPLAWKGLQGSGTSTTSSVSRATFVNSCCAAMGSLAAGFLLPRIAGLWGSFAVLASLAASVLLLFHDKSALTKTPLAALLVAISIAWFPAIKSPEQYYASSTERVLHRWNSSYGWVDVVQDSRSSVRRIRQNLHYRFGATGATAEREFRQATLPLLLHPSPLQVAFLGVGTGMTAAGAVPHADVQQISLVELIPEVFDAARILEGDNRNVIDDPRTMRFPDDARHFLSSTTGLFDVIIADLFVPWESGSGYLYTTDMYRSAKARLKPGGHFCQWLALYQLGETDFEMIARSMRSVFPHVSLWWCHLHPTKPIIALIGSDKPLTFDSQQIDRRIHNLETSGNAIDSLIPSSSRLAELYIGDWQEMIGLLNTDEFPRLEFSAPVSHLSGSLLKGDRLKLLIRDKLLKLPTASSYSWRLSADTPRRDRRWQLTVLFPSDVQE